MIDTVRRHLCGAWVGGVPPGWTRRESDVLSEGGEGRRVSTSVFMTHEATGLRVWGDKAAPQFMECSLPRQVYPSNGYLLANQQEIEGAHAAAVDRLADVIDLEDLGRYTRIDTVWQFKGDPAAWVRNLSSVRWPYTRKAPRCFFDQSVDWMGSRVGLRIYDKALESYGKPGDVVRVELQANSAALRSSANRGADLPVNTLMRAREDLDSGLPVELLYPWYRGHVRRLPAFTVAPRGDRLSIYGFLAALDSAACKINGVGAVDFWLSDRHDRTKRRTLHRMAAMRVRDVLRVDIAAMLPEESLPPVVHCIAA